MRVERTVLVDQPATLLFDVIEAAEHYPCFLPWCSGAQILVRDDSLVAAELQVRWHGLAFSLRTRNPKQRPLHMAIQLEAGPFRHFHGEWLLTPLAPDACKVVFRLDVEAAGVLLAQLTGPVLSRVAGTVVDAFVRRAGSVANEAARPGAAAQPAPGQLSPPSTPG
jgi:ribosome-associated toxin RatA of RatAB toxin-antitoxin module